MAIRYFVLGFSVVLVSVGAWLFHPGFGLIVFGGLVGAATLLYRGGES